MTKLFRYPVQAFGTLDFTGKGYIEAQNIYNHALLFSSPFTKAELKEFCEDQVFKGHQEKMSLDQFRKYFYQKQAHKQMQNESDSEQE